MRRPANRFAIASRWLTAAALLLPLLVSAAAAAAPWRPAAAPVDFNRDVLPILSENCFTCHGMDRNKRMAGLRLDTVDALKPLPGGRVAVVPGNLKASALYQRITAKDAQVMPPAYSGKKKLTPPQIETLRRWIEQGAHYAPHWAYIPPKRPPLPTVQDARSPRNPIARFILARLETEALRPSPAADRYTLIRRLSLD